MTFANVWVEIHKTSLSKFVRFFVTLGLIILKILSIKVVFEANIIKNDVTVIIINYLFTMNNCVVKASESYKNLTNLLKKFCEFPPCVLHKGLYTPL